MRSFEFARKKVDEQFVEEKAYINARLPQYQTKYAAGADFFAAEDVTIPSLWDLYIRKYLDYFASCFSVKNTKEDYIKPTLIPTGIKANMEEDEVLLLYNRSSNPKRGLILGNGVGVIDSDYYNNEENDGNIMFAFFNIKPWSVTVKAGDRIGQGVFQKYLRPEVGLDVIDEERAGGFGSTGAK